MLLTPKQVETMQRSRVATELNRRDLPDHVRQYWTRMQDILDNGRDGRTGGSATHLARIVDRALSPR
jgi:hypothetical protein